MYYITLNPLEPLYEGTKNPFFPFFVYLRSLWIMIKKKYIIALLLKIFTGNIFHFQYIKSQYRQTNKTQKIEGWTNQQTKVHA